MSRLQKLRVEEFSDEWEESTLATLLKFKNEINGFKEHYRKEIKFINILDILNHYFITYEKILGRVDVN